MKNFVGLDVSLKEVAICVVDENGVIMREGSVVSEPDEIAGWIGALDVEVTRIGLEIGGLSRWLYGELRGMGLPVTCIDPRHLRGLTKTMPVKTDRNDARSIAQVMRVGWYRVMHIKSEPSQELRSLALLTRCQRWSTLRAWGMAVAKRRGMRRAVVAVSRKLAVLMHRIWTDGTEFRWTKEEAAMA